MSRASSSILLAGIKDDGMLFALSAQGADGAVAFFKQISATPTGRVQVVGEYVSFL